MKKYLTFLLLLICISVSANSIDSLLVQFETSKGETHVRFANELLKTISEAGFLKNYKEISADEQKEKVDAYVYCSMGTYFLFTSDNHRGIECYEKGIELYRKMGNTAKQTDNLLFLHFCYKTSGNYPKALECLQECLDVYTERNDDLWKGRTLYSIGQLYSEMDKDDLAIEYMEEALALQRKADEPRYYTPTLVILAEAYLKTNELEKAEARALEGLSIALEENNELVASYWVLGQVYKSKKEYVKSMEYLQKALEVNEEKQGTIADKAFVYYLMGDVLTEEGKKMDLAEEYLLKAISLSEEAQNTYYQQLAYKCLTKLNYTRNPAKALEYFQKYVDIKEQLFTEQTHAQVNEFQVKYDTQQKELEIVRKQSEIDKHKTRQYIYIGGLAIAGILLLLFIYIIRLNRKRNQELREMNATKDKFFSIISHDLRNPAIAQRNALQALVNHDDEWDGEVVKQYHEELLKSADGSLELLYDLLNWAQVQTGRMPYHPTIFDLTDVVKTETKLMKNAIESKTIQLSLQMPETVVVQGDRNMLATIIRNLLTNAVKFTESGGEVSVNITQTGDGNYFVNIIDTGIGMSKEQINNLFRIDRQQSKSGTAGEKGSGLGLIVCKELIEKHGSAFKIESAPEKGSQFGFMVSRG